MSGRTAIFLSVRDKATRLPGKVMRRIHGKPAVEHLIDRLKLSREADMLVMTTSGNRADDALVALASQCQIGCFRGSEDDKLARYLDAARAFDVGFCVIVDGDDLFADVAFVDQIVRNWRSAKGDYIIVDRLPVGATPFGVSTQALSRAVALKAETNTEVWGGYFTDTGLFDCRALPPQNAALARLDLRMTLDYPEDLAFFIAVFDELYRPGEVFAFDEIVALLERRPDIAAINQGAQHRYEERLRTAPPIRLRTSPSPSLTAAPATSGPRP